MAGKTRWIIMGIMLTLLLFLAVATAWAEALAQGEVETQAALGTTFTYQGRLNKNGQPISNDCELAFRLYDQETTGNQIGSAITTTVSISNSLFTVKLNFGSAVFTGDSRWLGIKAKCPGDTAFADLGRQELTAAPYALYAASTGALQGRPITTTAPATGQVLGWDGSAWTPTFTGGGIYNARPVFSLTTLDSAGDVGNYSAMTIGADGLGLISYYDTTNTALKVAHCNDVACTSATLSMLDNTGDVGQFTSVTIGADGLGLIIYVDNTNKALKVAHCNDVACTNATLTTLDSDGEVGFDSSVTVGTDGRGLISYWDRTNTNLKVAHCNDVACTSATITTLDNAGDVGACTSVTIGADGLGLIIYTDSTAPALKVAHCNDVACTGATLTTLDNNGQVGIHTSVTIGSDGLGLISYRENTWGAGELRVAHCNNTTCTGAITTTLDSDGGPVFTSITMGADGLGLISYSDSAPLPAPHVLKVAHCNDIACTSATVATLDNAEVSGATSVTIAMDGLGLISYYNSTDTALKVAHCSNIFCVPYFRRR